MPWQGTGRGTGSDVPKAVRRAVRLRDQDTCQLGYDCCTGTYEELDHIIGVAARGVDRMDTLTVEELQCVCRPCHKRKTQWQAQQGRALGKREPERDHRLGQVLLPNAFRYAPPRGPTPSPVPPPRR